MTTEPYKTDVGADSIGGEFGHEVYNRWPRLMGGVPAAREYSGGFGSDLMLKDLGLAPQAALARNSSTPLGALARQLYQLHSQAGNGGSISPAS